MPPILSQQYHPMHRCQVYSDAKSSIVKEVHHPPNFFYNKPDFIRRWLHLHHFRIMESTTGKVSCHFIWWLQHISSYCVCCHKIFRCFLPNLEGSPWHFGKFFTCMTCALNSSSTENDNIILNLPFFFFFQTKQPWGIWCINEVSHELFSMLKKRHFEYNNGKK